MRHALAAASILLVTSAAALADPAPIRLTRAQVDAAMKSVQGKLPKVDTTRLPQCQKLSDAYNANPAVTPLMSAAACYRSIGSLGAALQEWHQVISYYPNTPEAKEALRQLGSTYEAAAFWSDSAEKEDEYARKYPGEHDARDLEIRAICTWEQLGADDQVEKSLAYIIKSWRNVTIDTAHLCDTVRPIPVVTP